MHISVKGEIMNGNKHDNGVHEIGTDEIKRAYQEDNWSNN